MPAKPSNNPHLTRSFASTFSLLILALVCQLPAFGQPNSPPMIQGYITSVESPDSFVVDQRHILVKPQTSLSWAGDKTPLYPGNIRDALQLGTFVQVYGYTDHHTRDVPAESISVRADWGHKLSGLGVIDKVISSGPEPVFRADGYPLHITSATDLTFSDQLNSLADIGTNTWVQYEARRDLSGAIVVSKATFIPGKPTKFKVIPRLEVSAMKLESPPDLKSSPAQNSAPGKEPKTRYSARNNKYQKSRNPDLQERVQRIGTSVVPAYQKALPDDDPSKIPFEFYAVDNKNIRSELLSIDGLILLPKEVIDRLKTDDQLAAVLADGVAYNLQRQAARIIAVNRIYLAAGIAGDIAGAFVPGLGVATWVGSGIAGSKVATTMQQQRSRVALALMHDAGYDLMQAPEAWRLLSPKHRPSDVDSLRYPEISGYQLSIISAEYSNKSENAATASLH